MRVVLYELEGDFDDPMIFATLAEAKRQRKFYGDYIGIHRLTSIEGQPRQVIAAIARGREWVAKREVIIPSDIERNPLWDEDGHLIERPSE